MDFVQKIDKLRDQIHQINEELTWLEESPVTKEEFRARVIEWVSEDCPANQRQGMHWWCLT